VISAPEYAFAAQLAALRIPFEREYRAAPPRRWRADFALVDARILVEVEGGIWVQGRHGRGSGFTKDLEKYAEFVCRGWRVLRVSPEMVRSGAALRYVERLLEGR